MARHNGLIKNELLTAGIEEYTGRVVKSIERHDDPQVVGSIAIRATLHRDVTSMGDVDAVVDFLISAQAPALITTEDVASHLEEAEYTSWPPTSGKISFF